MTIKHARAFLNPPIRLRTLSDRWTTWLRAAWTFLFGLAMLTVVVSSMYAIRASYWVQPVIEEFGLDFEVTTEGKLVVGTAARRRPAMPVTSKVVAIDGRTVAPDLEVVGFAELLDAAPGPRVKLSLMPPGGRVETLDLRRATVNHPASVEQARNLRTWARLVAGLLACGVLLACSLLLALRRPDDPVAMLLSLAFIGLAATVDPPLQFWLWTDQAIVLDIAGAILFYCLLIGLATFPDGVFVPRFLRWLVPLGIPVAIFVSLADVDEDVQGILGMAVLTAVLLSQAVRFRRERDGIARQQIKWAGFGFAAGFVLLLAAVILAAALGDDPSQYTPLISLVVLLLFSTGMTAVALGLLIALIRFRLWEADRVITRSAAYAVVTLIVGVVWAASSDLVKLIITEVMGRDSEAGATTVGAIIAAGIFSPTQSAVLGWTRRRFGGPLDQIRDSAKRLKNRGLTETPEEVANCALELIDRAVHPAASAITLDLQPDREMAVCRNASSATGPRLIERLDLADEGTPVGSLLIGRRSDGNRYNRQELKAIQQLVPYLAEALRVARGRLSREDMMQRRLDEMAARLAQIEGTAPKPA